MKKLIDSPKECGHRFYLEKDQWPTIRERIFCHHPCNDPDKVKFCSDSKDFPKDCLLKDGMLFKAPIKRRSRTKCINYIGDDLGLNRLEGFCRLDTHVCRGVKCNEYESSTKTLLKNAPNNSTN